MSSRIEQIIDEIEEYIDRDCKYQPLSTTKIVVNKEHLEELLRELRLKTPEEIKRYQKIIANRDAILADAKAKADSMIEEAQVQTTELVSEHEIMQQAYAQANEIVTQATAQAQEIIDNATSDANAIRIGAIQYTDDLLANAESIIGHTLDSYTTKYDGLINSLQECYDTVRSNRAELDIPEDDDYSSSEDEKFLENRLQKIQIKSCQKTGCPCGSQFLYNIVRCFQTGILYHTLCLRHRAQSAERCKRHNQSPGQRQPHIKTVYDKNSVRHFQDGCQCCKNRAVLSGF